MKEIDELEENVKSAEAAASICKAYSPFLVALESRSLMCDYFVYQFIQFDIFSFCYFLSFPVIDLQWEGRFP